jgi:hypothetical protein
LQLPAGNGAPIISNNQAGSPGAATRC